MHLKKEYCVHGHKLTDDSIYIRPNGVIECRICIRDSGAKCRQSTKRINYMQIWTQSVNGIVSQKKRDSNRDKSFRLISNRNNNFIKKCIADKSLIKKDVCNDCLKLNNNGIKYTEIHHIIYYELPRLTDIVEVCIHCHIKRHKKGEGKQIVYVN